MYGQLLSTAWVIGISLLMVPSLQAQPPFRLGSSMRPMMPPMPVAPGFARGPGLVPVPSIVVPVPAVGYTVYSNRSAYLVPVPTTVRPTAGTYSAARIAVVQPNMPQQSPSTYRAGNSVYRTPSTNSAATQDLRPGMVLPDGAVVVSVGQPRASTNGVSSSVNAATTSNPSATVASASAQVTGQPNAAPVPAPVNVTNTDQLRSILEAPEELPQPQPTAGSDKKIEKTTQRQF